MNNPEPIVWLMGLVGVVGAGVTVAWVNWVSKSVVEHAERHATCQASFKALEERTKAIDEKLDVLIKRELGTWGE